MLKRKEYKKNPISKMWVFTILGAVIAVVSLGGALQLKAQYEDSDIVAYVNNEPITVREYTSILLRKRASTYAYFKEKYGVEDSKDFWKSGHGGETPLEKIKKDAMEASTEIKVKQAYAKQNGLLEDASYEKFLMDLVKENKRRADALKKNQVIYGPQQYGEDAYFDVLFGNMEAALKEKLSKAWTFEEKDYEQYYQENKDQYFKSEGTVKIQKIAVPYAPINDSTRETAEAIMKEIKARLAQGEDFESIRQGYGKDPSKKVISSEQTLDSKSFREDSLRWPILLKESRSLSVGQVSSMFEEQNTFYIMKCYEKENNRYMLLEEVKEKIKTNLSEEKYEKIMEQQLKEARLQINEKVLGRIDEKYLR